MLTSAVHLLLVIPARLGSTRLPGKPLRTIAGEPLISLVVRNVLEWRLDASVVVAADDPRILEAVAPLGVQGWHARSDHRCGTERVAEVVAHPSFGKVDVIVNVQGDQPFLSRDTVEAVLQRMAQGDSLATAAAALRRGALADAARVKVVVDRGGWALRFSRVVPASTTWPCDVEVLEHIGVYGYTPQALRRWVQLPLVAEEARDGLEQLRPLAHGIPIGVARVGGEAPLSIDTEEDLALAQVSVRAVGSGGELR